jgi:hypothetical protein
VSTLKSEFDTEAMFPKMKRRWNVTIFRHEMSDNNVGNVVLKEYQNVRSKWITGGVVDHDGVLAFIDENRREVVARSVPFIATEIDSIP